MANDNIGFDILRRLLRPTVRFLLRRSYTFQDFINLAKVVFVDVAKEEINAQGDKVNISRISMLTGLHRPDVRRIYREQTISDERSENILGRILIKWYHEPQYTTKAGHPRVLSYEGEDSEFRELVRSMTKNYSPGTVLSELERLEAVQRTSRGLKPLRPLLWTGADPGRGLEILSDDMETLFEAIEENLFSEPATPNLHIRTTYDNIFYRDLPRIRRWLVDEGKLFHQKVRNYLAQFDKDISVEHGDMRSGARVTVTAVSLTSSPEEERIEKARVDG